MTRTLRRTLAVAGALLVVGCGGQHGDTGSQKNFPEPTPSCVACDAGYHCASDGQSCVKD